MHLGRAGIAHHLHDLLGGGAAHDAVVHQHDALAGDVRAVGVVLQAHAEMADLVGRLDEGAADIVVADDAVFERDAGGGGIAEGGGHAGIRHRDHHVGNRRRFLGQLRADALARIIDAVALHHAVGPREIHILEDAEALRLDAERLHGGDAALVEDDELARLDVAHIVGADDVEGAGLGREDPAVAPLAQHHRTDAERIAHADHHVVGDADQRIGALDLVQRVDQAVDHVAAQVRRHQMQDDLGVAGRLEHRAALHQLLPDHLGVGEVAVVGDREAAEMQIAEQRLHVAQRILAGGRITRVADRGVAGQLADHGLMREVVGDVALGAVRIEALPVKGDDAGRLLAAMLQGMQAQHAMGRGLLDAIDSDNATLLLQMIVIERMGR